MDKVISAIQFIVAHASDFLAALIAFLTAVIGICLLVPGSQPEAFLQGVVDFLTKFSVKKKD